MGLPIHHRINISFPEKYISSSPNKVYDNNNYQNLIIDGKAIACEDISQDIQHSSHSLVLDWFLEAREVITIDIKDIHHAPKISGMLAEQNIYIYSNLNFSIDTFVYSQIDVNNVSLTFRWKHNSFISCGISFDIITGNSCNLYDNYI
ncbi:MAG: hypothetical protein ACFB02_15550 [Mastigocoleus sp.]